MPKAKVKVEEKKEVVKLKCPTCTHPEEMHYGGKNGHCNTENCECLEFK